MTRTIPTVLAALAMLTLGACSGADDGASPVPAAPTTQTASPAPSARSQADRDAAAASGPRGDCDLLSVAEIEEAFGNRLRVTRVGGYGPRGNGCTVSIAEGTETQLVFQAGGQAAYDARKEAYRSQSSVTREPVSIGTEAYLVNGGQVIAVDAEGRSISIGLMLLVFNGQAPVTPTEVAAGVQSLARLALERI
jgi:hypothetical protein